MNKNYYQQELLPRFHPDFRCLSEHKILLNGNGAIKVIGKWTSSIVMGTFLILTMDILLFRLWDYTLTLSELAKS